MYRHCMRTTIDLPDELHALTSAVARDAGTSLSETVTRLLQVALGAPGPFTLSVSPVTGLTVFSNGRTVTSEDVRSLEDEE